LFHAHYGRVHYNGNNQEIYKKIRCGIADDCGMHGTHRRRIYQEIMYQMDEIIPKSTNVLIVKEILREKLL
jgi:hypothetical protein